MSGRLVRETPLVVDDPAAPALSRADLEADWRRQRAAIDGLTRTVESQKCTIDLVRGQNRKLREQVEGFAKSVEEINASLSAAMPDDYNLHRAMRPGGPLDRMEEARR